MSSSTDPSESSGVGRYESGEAEKPSAIEGETLAVSIAGGFSGLFSSRATNELVE